MKTADLLSEMGITQEMLSIFTGIPRNRIAKWAVKNIDPPKADDAAIINKFYSDYKSFGADQLKSLYDEIVKKGTEENKDVVTDSSGKKKQVITLGKHVPLRLNAKQHAEAFGNWKGLPMYNVPITASFVEVYRDERTYQPEYYLPDKRFRDCDFGAIIKGDSMHDEIRHGDFIACKEITDTRFIVYGDIYYIVSTNGLETCKYINADKNNPDVLLLMAKNEKISVSPLPIDMLHKLYKVRGIVRSY